MSLFGAYGQNFCPTPRPSLLEKMIWEHDRYIWTRQVNTSLMKSVTNLRKVNGHHDSFMLFGHPRLSRLQKMQSQRNVLKYFTFLYAMWNVPIRCVTLCGHPQASEVQTFWEQGSILVYFWGTLWYSTFLFQSLWLFSLFKGNRTLDIYSTGNQAWLYKCILKKKKKLRKKERKEKHHQSFLSYHALMRLYFTYIKWKKKKKKFKEPRHWPS